MVELEGKDIKKQPDLLSKKAKIGNDKRQFIVRIPVKISRKSILKDFDHQYTATVEINTKKPDEIIVRIKK